MPGFSFYSVKDLFECSFFLFSTCVVVICFNYGSCMESSEANMYVIKLTTEKHKVLLT